MIADRYFSTDNAERAQALLANALKLLEASPDAALRSRLTCKHAATSAEIGNAESALRIMYAEAARRDVDPEAAALCLLRTARSISPSIVMPRDCATRRPVSNEPARVAAAWSKQRC